MFKLSNINRLEREKNTPKSYNFKSRENCTIPPIIKNIFSLQKSIGNKGVKRLLEGTGIRNQGSGVRIQTKPKISQVDDIFEQESDRVANVVTRMPWESITGENVSDFTNSISSSTEQKARNTQTTVSHSISQETAEELRSRDYPGCDAVQDFHVDFARMRAPRWIASTVSDLDDYLNNPRETITVIESTLNRFFHPPPPERGRIRRRHDPKTVRIIINRLRRMRQAIENPGLFRCVTRRTCGRENSSHDPDAYAYAGQGTRISICPAFFELGLNDQLSTIIHESAHHIGLMRNVIPREDVINLPLHRAMNNAESYALLVTENFIGPPVQVMPPPAPLTTNWSTAYMSSQVMFTHPVNELFYEGQGQRHYLSERRGLIEAPFPSVQPIRFKGQVRFYTDTADMPMPQGHILPEVRVQILFTPSGTGESTLTLYEHSDPNPEYLGPELPLLVSFSPDFDFTISQNGSIRFTFWMSDANNFFIAMYDDTITVIPDNDI